VGGVSGEKEREGKREGEGEREGEVKKAFGLVFLLQHLCAIGSL
jgi:hypothetical protein